MSDKPEKTIDKIPKFINEVLDLPETKKDPAMVAAIAELIKSIKDF